MSFLLSDGFENSMETPLIILSMLKEDYTPSSSELTASLSKSGGTIQPSLRNLHGQGLVGRVDFVKSRYWELLA